MARLPGGADQHRDQGRGRLRRRLVPAQRRGSSPPSSSLGRAEGIIVASFNDAALRRFHELAPQIDLAPAIAGVAAYKLGGVPPPRAPSPSRCRSSSAGSPSSTRPFVDRAHADGYAVHVWTINDEPTMNQLLDWGVDGIMTAEPIRLERVLCAARRARPPRPPGIPGKPLQPSPRLDRLRRRRPGPVRLLPHACGSRSRAKDDCRAGAPVASRCCRRGSGTWPASTSANCHRQGRPESLRIAIPLSPTTERSPSRAAVAVGRRPRTPSRGARSGFSSSSSRGRELTKTAPVPKNDSMAAVPRNRGPSGERAAARRLRRAGFGPKAWEAGRSARKGTRWRGRVAARSAECEARRPRSGRRRRPADRPL